MRIAMEIELKDIPGQLLSALGPIADLGGNIISIAHQRDRRTPRGTIPIKITIELPEKHLDELIARWHERGITVMQKGEERLKESVFLILIGHIVHTDLKSTIDAVDSTGFAEVVDLTLMMPGIDEESSAGITIKATGKKEMERAIEILEQEAKKKGLLMIKPLEGF
ncbi:MAG TPA: amino acid-binding protein [Candidatus Syntrophoarchaeum butanivorans]|uniref:Amino acid-binding protein n=1 Tax=Candidatus Syntropharchaeum butanivorans TaxID=1839936 RepID=A0A7C0X394_9EURY|nr:MAG: amino acid-binding protein [Candidatus Syntrophoarchaeum sp. WYZ-LMO15]HDM36804.1 amino acid-binding protein [Candidatus Syntrophoarchaeum butanivorans]